MAKGGGRKSAARKRAERHGYRSAFEQRFAKKHPDLLFEPESFPYCYEEKQVWTYTPPAGPAPRLLESKNITRTYTPDFVSKDGSVWYELKGALDAADRKKMKAVRASYPNQRIIMVFQRPQNKLTKAAKSKTYAQWAESVGLEWQSEARMD